ncbi:TetR family transcriptional regulator C-terminal domain-containing protein [Paraburkholderia pallida]|uniref:Tetracyclin repressor-like C-terminal domain-containing protein n=1 Tax=Paraburkholderia pallida TaxID=2547399 RepID=A0A4P7CWY4_9BURK|nr:hypothetical protein E1956_20090 [Paraburkholderia pallida]
MDRVRERLRNAAHDGHEMLERGLRNAIDKGQLSQDLDTARAADVVHAFPSARGHDPSDLANASAALPTRFIKRRRYQNVHSVSAP